MHVLRRVAPVLGLVVVLSWPVATAERSASAPTFREFLSPASPLEVVAAKNVDRVAWVAFEEGKRNAYTAAAPAFTPVRLTSFMKDDGIDMSDIRISDDGRAVVFVRGTAPNRSGWVANATANPDGAERAIWAARTSGGPAWRVAEGGAPELAPDGSSVLFVKDDQIHRAKVTPVPPSREIDRGEKPFIKEWGAQSAPAWSPDGRRIAFVSNRTDHSFVAVYDMAARTVKYMAPSVDFDTSPAWSPDGKSVVFVRRPGLAFGQQAQPGTGSLGVPSGPAFVEQGRGGSPLRIAETPGLARATFRGGYTLSVMKADVTTGEARELWHNEAKDTKFPSIANLRVGAGHAVFMSSFGGGRGGRGRGGVPEPPPPAAGPVDEWDRYYSLTTTDSGARPVLLTTTDGLIEDQTSIALSPDGRTFYYCTNAGDIERRHIWAVPLSGGTPRQLTTGKGIETSPAPLASGKRLATLSADWKMPQSLGIWPLGAASGSPRRPDLRSPGRPGLRSPGRPDLQVGRDTESGQKIVFPSSRKGFPAEAHVEPQLVITKAADGLEIHNQLFVPKDMAAGEKRPAIVFVHGGPVRQMLLGYHYMQFYHWAYGINQWLASQGYVVMSINYRSGVGYGRSFRMAPNTGGRGNAEYQDVVAGGKYLQSRPDVDPNRIGIWGLSYGGVLTSQALARDSDMFKAGVDLAGVHLWGSSLDPDAVTFKSSTVGAIDGWKSPVLLVHGDDDRNVAFQQTTGLVQLLRQRDVYYELIVFPDDTHESLLHSRWMYTLERMDGFLRKFLRSGSTITTNRAGSN